MIDIFSKNNDYLISPKILTADAKFINKVWEEQKLSSHVFILSSGTSSSETYKTYALSKKSLINNAKAVNELIKASSEDIWLASLPHYHVGGLSIYIRAALSNSHVKKHDGSRWSPERFVSILNQEKINFCSLVPTQVYDLCQKKAKAPASIKAVFVGGDFLHDSLLRQFTKLGWPVYITYGMTEVCSQLATSYYKNIDDGFIDILPIHKVSEKEGDFYIESQSLYTSMCQINVKDQTYKVEISTKSFHLSDHILLQGNRLKPLGRKDDLFKINGRLYSLLEIKNIAYSLFEDLEIYGHAEIIIEENLRNGKNLKLLLEKEFKDISEEILSLLNKTLPIQVQHIEIIDEIEKTELGKIKKLKIMP